MRYRPTNDSDLFNRFLLAENDAGGNPRSGTSFDSFLREEGILEEVEAAATKRVADHDAGGKAKWPMPAGWTVHAEFSGDNDCYRHSLFHGWEKVGPLAMWCLMNPSTADHRTLDPTVSKTGRISKRLGCAGQFIANACAYRATDRMRLLTVADPVGPTNAVAIKAMARAIAESGGMIIIAHGRLPGDLQKHADAMCRLLLDAGHKLHVLRLTPDNVPFHPLARGKAHIPEDVVPQEWSGPYV